MVNRWAVRDDTCTVLCRTFLYALVQHTRKSQLTDGDMYLNMTFRPVRTAFLLHSWAFQACKTCGVA
jgi:hypothetical protein